MSLEIRKVKLAVGTDYPLAGVLNRGRGLLLRGPVNAETTKYSQLNRLQPDQIIYSKLKAFEGAITVAPNDIDERYASSEFPTFTCKPDLLPAFFRLRTTEADFWEQLALLSKGMGGRRERLSPEDFLTLELSIPPIAEQQKAVGLMSVVECSIRESDQELSSLRQLRSELLPALLSGAHRIPETYDELMGA
jgi:type I restriction enzyme S subunit